MTESAPPKKLRPAFLAALLLVLGMALYSFLPALASSMLLFWAQSWSVEKKIVSGSQGLCEEGLTEMNSYSEEQKKNMLPFFRRHMEMSKEDFTSVAKGGAIVSWLVNEVESLSGQAVGQTITAEKCLISAVPKLGPLVVEIMPSYSRMILLKRSNISPFEIITVFKDLGSAEAKAALVQEIVKNAEHPNVKLLLQLYSMLYSEKFGSIDVALEEMKIDPKIKKNIFSNHISQLSSIQTGPDLEQEHLNIILDKDLEDAVRLQTLQQKGWSKPNPDLKIENTFELIDDKSENISSISTQQLLPGIAFQHKDGPRIFAKYINQKIVTQPLQDEIVLKRIQKVANVIQHFSNKRIDSVENTEVLSVEVQKLLRKIVKESSWTTTTFSQLAQAVIRGPLSSSLAGFFMEAESSGDKEFKKQSFAYLIQIEKIPEQILNDIAEYLKRSSAEDREPMLIALSARRDRIYPVINDRLEGVLIDIALEGDDLTQNTLLYALRNHKDRFIPLIKRKISSGEGGSLKKNQMLTLLTEVDPTEENTDALLPALNALKDCSLTHKKMLRVYNNYLLKTGKKQPDSVIASSEKCGLKSRQPSQEDGAESTTEGFEEDYEH